MTRNLDLFGDVLFDVPVTEGIKYTGSKLKLLPHILNLANKTGAKTILDGFSGTTRVSQAFAQSGYRVVSNDIASQPTDGSRSITGDLQTAASPFRTTD